MGRVEGHVDRLGGHSSARRIHDLRLRRHAVDHDRNIGIGIVEDDAGRGVGVVRDARGAPQLGDIIELREIDGFNRLDGGYSPGDRARQGHGIHVDDVAGEISRRIAQGDPGDAVTAGVIGVMATGRENGGGAQERAR